MKSMLKKLFSLLMLLVPVFMVGCGNSQEVQEQETVSKNKSKEYDLLVYNSDYKISESFNKMCEEYSDRTGVIIKVINRFEDENNDEILSSYMNSSNPPDIFTISSTAELNNWKEKGNVFDFSNATEENFKEVVNNIPNALKLSSNTVDSFGIPYTVECSGLLVDPKMLSSLFGGERYKSFLSELKTCPYEDFESFVNALSMYISSGQVYQFKLNDNTYSFLTSKGELVKNLNGVFSYAAGDTVYTGNYVLNPILNSTCNSAAALNVASDSTIDKFSTPIMKFAKFLDLITSNVSGKNETVSRGNDLINNTTNSKNQAMKNFVNGKSLFLFATNLDYDKLFTLNSTVANRAVFIPVKVPLEENDVTASDVTLKQLNKSITAYSPNYFVINAKSSDSNKKLCQDFLVWFRTSALAEKYIINEFNFVPYNITDSSLISNPLSRSMIEYLSAGQIIPAVIDGVPDEWRYNTFANHIIKQYFTKPSWAYSDYEKISNYFVENLKKFKNGE